MDSGDGAGGEALDEGVEGEAIVGVVKGGDEDEIVCDVEVGVTSGKTLILEDDGGGHWKGTDGEGFVVKRAGLVETLQVFREGEMVFIGGVGLDAGEDSVSQVIGAGHEAGDVVDVAVGVIAGAAAVEPDNLIDAEEVVEGGFELVASSARIALLNVRQEALFGGEKDSLPIRVDRSAFKDEAVLGAVGEGDYGGKAGHGVKLGNVLGDEVVVAVIVVLGPGVKLPVRQGDGASGVAEEDGAGIAEPDAIGAPAVEVQACKVSASASEHLGGATLGECVVYEDVDVFLARKVSHDFAVDPGNRLKFIGPIFGVVRPGDPGGGVGRPFSGHTEI